VPHRWPQAAAELMQALAALMAASRIVYLRLGRLYPGLLSYVAFLALLNAVLGAQTSNSPGYFYSYLILEPLKCLVGFIAVRELVALIFDSYPGIRTAGRWAMYFGITVAIIISLVATLWTASAHGSHKLFYLEVCQRWIIFALALVIVAIVAFISRYPLHLARNTLFSCTCFTAMFLSDAVRLFLDNRAQYLYNIYVDRSESGFECICLLTWTALLRPCGDKLAPQAARHSPREKYLMEQLEAMNRLLAHVSRQGVSDGAVTPH
jgi:hypothetical protein